MVYLQYMLYMHPKRFIGFWLLASITATCIHANQSTNTMDDKKKSQSNATSPTLLMDHGKLTSEQTEYASMLSFLYTTTVGHWVCNLINRRSINKLYALYQNSGISKHAIAPFIKKHNIAMDDFEQPSDGYQSFNDFFIRKLKPGRRPIDANPKTIIAPADSKLLVIPQITQHTTFFVKGKPFNLVSFLQDPHKAAEYLNGTMLIFRLAPYDYHRFHFPASGMPGAPYTVTGRFDSVNPVVYKAGYQPLISNERHLIELQTKDFDTILMIPVGAMLVGKIVETYTPNHPIDKGAEAGYFAFGGSTVVLLFKPEIINPKPHFIENSMQGFETIVKMGEAITE